jgi:hypothetical protein
MPAWRGVIGTRREERHREQEGSAGREVVMNSARDRGSTRVVMRRAVVLIPGVRVRRVGFLATLVAGQVG